MIADLDVAQLRNRFAVPWVKSYMPKDEAIRVLEEFRDADPFVPSGDELWFGRSNNVEADTTSNQSFLFLRVRAAIDAFSGQLVIEGFHDDGDAHRVLRALMGGQPAPSSSHIVEYMKTAEPDQGWHPLVQTAGRSKVVREKSPIWLRQKGNRVLLIEKLPPQSPDRMTPFHGAGRYAELWKL